MTQYKCSEKQLKNALFSALEELKEEIFRQVATKLSPPEEKAKKPPAKETKEKPKKTETKKQTTTAKEASPVPTRKTSAKKTSASKKDEISPPKKDFDFVEAEKRVCTSTRAKAFKTQAYYNVNVGRAHTKSAAMLKKYDFYSGDGSFIAGEKDSQKLTDALKQYADQSRDLVLEGEAKVSENSKKTKKTKLPTITQIVADEKGVVKTEEGFVIDPTAGAIIGVEEDSGEIRDLNKKESTTARKLYPVYSELTKQEMKKLQRESRRDPGEIIDVISNPDPEPEEEFAKKIVKEEELVIQKKKVKETKDGLTRMIEEATKEAAERKKIQKSKEIASEEKKKKVSKKPKASTSDDDTDIEELVQKEMMALEAKEESRKQKEAKEESKKQKEVDEQEEENDVDEEVEDEEEDDEEKEDFIKLYKVLNDSKPKIAMSQKTVIASKTKLEKSRVEELLRNYEVLKKKYIST